MTLPQNVADAAKELDAVHDERFAPWRNQWQTIRAHLMSQEAEIERLNAEWHEMFDRALLAESRLAAADALLREIMDFGEDRKLHIRIQSHLQGAGDEAV